MLYLDKRVCDEKYINRSSKDSQLFFSEEEKGAMDAVREEHTCSGMTKKPVIMEPQPMCASEHSELQFGIV